MLFHSHLPSCHFILSLFNTQTIPLSLLCSLSVNFGHFSFSLYYCFVQSLLEAAVIRASARASEAGQASTGRHAHGVPPLPALCASRLQIYFAFLYLRECYFSLSLSLLLCVFCCRRQGYEPWWYTHTHAFSQTLLLLIRRTNVSSNDVFRIQTDSEQQQQQQVFKEQIRLITVSLPEVNFESSDRSRQMSRSRSWSVRLKTEWQFWSVSFNWMAVMMAGRWSPSHNPNPVYYSNHSNTAGQFAPPGQRVRPLNPRSNYYLIVCYVCQEMAKPNQEHTLHYGGIVCFSCRAVFRRAHQVCHQECLK